MPQTSRGVPRPARLPDYHNNLGNARLVALGNYFGDERHWFALPTTQNPSNGISRRCRRHTCPGRCPGCLAGVDFNWFPYIPAVRLRGNHIAERKPGLVAWNVPRELVDVVEGEIRGVTFDIIRDALGTLRISRTQHGPPGELPEAFDVDAFLDAREKIARPIQPVPYADETTAEAIQRYLAAERDLALFARQPALPGFEEPVRAHEPQSIPGPMSPEQIRQVLRSRGFVKGGE